jgi:hypothetical protein
MSVSGDSVLSTSFEPFIKFGPNRPRHRSFQIVRHDAPGSVTTTIRQPLGKNSTLTINTVNPWFLITSRVICSTWSEFMGL